MKIVRYAVIALAAGALAMTGCKSEQKASTGAAPAATVKSASYVNKRCPMSGEPVSGEVSTVSYQGKNVGFCCNSCAGKFNNLTDAQKAEKVAAASK